MVQFGDSIKSRVMENRFKHKHITPLMIEKVNSANLILLLTWWDRTKVLHRYNQCVLAEDSHCVVYPDGLMHNYYTGETNNVLNTLMTYFDLDFPQAFYVANYFIYKVNKAEVQEYIDSCCIAPPVVVDKSQVDFGSMAISDSLQSTLPDIKSAALRRVYFYLNHVRKIKRDIISNFIKRRLIALDGRNNLCFLTYCGDEIVAVTKKGTDPSRPFKQNLVKEVHTGFFYAPVSAGKSYSDIYVFESCIDLMSYLSLINEGEVDRPTETSCFISLNGAGTQYLTRILLGHPEIHTVHMCLDNDSVSSHATKKFIDYNPHRNIIDERSALRRYEGINAHVKDWNDMLSRAIDSRPF